MNKESKENVIEFDEETQRLVKLGCEKLNMTPEQLVEEAIRCFIEKHGAEAK